MLWNQRLYAWSGSPAGGTIVREFGMIRCLTVTTRVTGPFGSPAQQTITGREWRWRIGAVAVNAAISIALTVTLGWWCRRMVRTDRLIGLCDECGYDLTGLHSEQCPECGAKTPNGQSSGA